MFDDDDEYDYTDLLYYRIFDVTDINLTNQLEAPVPDRWSLWSPMSNSFNNIFIDDYHCIFRYYLVFLII